MLDHVAFGALVKRKRGEKKLLPKTLAVNVFGDPRRKRQIARIENATILPQEDIVQKLCAVLEISDAEMAGIRSHHLVTLLRQIPALSRDEMDLLAFHFGADGPHDQSDNELRSFLTLKADEYTKQRERITDLAAASAQVAAVLDALDAALEDGDFETAKALLQSARVGSDDGLDDDPRATLEADARLMEQQAAIALLQGKVGEAQVMLTGAADSFAGLDAQEPARRKIFEYVDILWDHGLRFGGDGLIRSRMMLRTTLNEQLEMTNGWLWAAGQNALAVVLSDQGGRLDGKQGSALLGQAVAACRQAMTVYTRDAYPVEWAMTQNNLGTALSDLGERTDDPEGTELLGQAVDAYRGALNVYTCAEHPMEWAMTQNNLGAALQEQGIHMAHPDGTEKLDQAITAYLESLTVRTRDDQPESWAMTQENLAMAEKALAEHDGCADPRRHLQAALTYVEAALGVYDSDYMPENHETAIGLWDSIRLALSERPDAA